MVEVEHYDAVVIGSGQAGLAAGHHLARHDIRFVILDAGRAIGETWRRRWDSLHLFTPASYDALPGMRFPAPRGHFPSKDEMADYLRAYATRFDLPVRLDTPVDQLEHDGTRFVVTAAGQQLTADAVVVATGALLTPRVPAFADRVNPDIVHLHSVDYRNPAQLQPGPVLVAGAGNSGAEISLELARTHQVTLAGRDTGRIPIKLGGLAYRIMDRMLAVGTPLGRRMIKKPFAAKGTPLVRVTREALADAGVQRASRVVGVDDQGQPVLEDGRSLDVANIVWCTGFHNWVYDWIKLPAFDEAGRPLHYRGVVDAVPGLYFLGLPYQYSMSSSLIGGVGRDAGYVVRKLAAAR